MKHFILLFSILLIFTSCAVKQETLTQEDVEKIILAQEHQVLDPWSAGDPIPFSKNFAEDATIFDDIGAQTRLDGLEEIQNYCATFVGNIPPHTYALVDPKCQVYGDIAIMTFHYDDGESAPWKVTDVYRFNNGEWKVVHAHWSLVKEQ